MQWSSKAILVAFCIFIVSIAIVIITGGYKFKTVDDLFYIRVNPNKLVFETDKMFLSIGLDTSFMRCTFYKLNDRLTLTYKCNFDQLIVIEHNLM